MRKAMEYQEDGNEGDHTESLKKFDAAATVENEELVSSVQARLANLNNITKEEDPAVSEEEDEDPTPGVTDDNNVEDDDPAESEDDPTDPTPDEGSVDGDDTGKEKVSIPDAYIRAAIHRGWEQEVIDELIESNPELAKKTLEATYLEVNNSSREWSALGRARRDQEAEEQNKTKTATEATEDLDNAVLIKELKEEYPNDPMVARAAKMLEATTEIANAKPKTQVQQVQQGQDQYQVATARANASANASMDQRVNNWFSSDVLSPYVKFYGKIELGQSLADLSAGQQQNRLAVLDEAEMILSGHRMRGINLEPEQALEKAHFMVTEPIREQIIRDNLKVTATKRKKGMTLRPSKSKRTGSESQGKPKNRNELISKVERKLASVPGLR